MNIYTSIVFDWSFRSFSIYYYPKKIICPENMLRQLRVYEELLSRSSGSLPYIHQIQNGHLTLGISKKNGRNKPKILLNVGKTDKLINDYLEICKKIQKHKYF